MVVIPNWVSKPIRRDLMWTPATRRQHSRENLRYETDLTDREWNLIAPMMPVASRTGRPRKWPLREIMNAIFHVMRGGIGWRLLPSDFPPKSTVCQNASV